MERRRLCLAIPCLQAGGMERVMSQLASYFVSKDSFEIHLVLYGITREMFYRVPESVIIHKPRFEFNNSVRLLHSLKTLFFLRKEIKQISPAAILSFGEYWNSFVLIALYRLRYPVFVSDRCQPDKNLGKMQNFLRRRLYPGCAGIIAQTEKAAEIYYSQHLHNNIIVIANPIRRISGERNIPREKIILTVGRLIHTKHHDKLIELFLSIPAPEWKLVIVGYDHLKQENSVRLREMIAEHNAGERVILEGKQADVEAYYLRSSIFAFTSSSEGFPNVIGEAMAAGLPVIAFDCVAGPSEMVKDNKNGFLIPLFDYEMFRHKLALLMENPALRKQFGTRAVNDISSFSVDIIGERFLQFMNLTQ